MAADTAVILVPGFKGSILSASGKPIWITLGQALLGKASLAVDRPDLGVLNPLRLADGGILEQVTVVPGLIKNDIYGSTVRAVRAGIPASWDFHAYHYDWRRDPDALVDDLDQFVTRLAAAGTRDIRLIAHSMGAMLSAAWLVRRSATGASHVSHAAFLAGAFRGTTKLFRNLQTGDDPSGRNTTLLSADALGTMPSSYAFVPDQWPLVVDTHGAPVATDFRDVALWESGRWGLFRDGAAAHAAARREFLRERFAVSRTFLHGIQDPAAVAPAALRTMSVIGTGFGTIDRLIQRADGSLVVTEAQRRADPALTSLSLEVDGDGTIAAHAAQLPPALAAKQVQPPLLLKADHMVVVQRGAGLSAAIDFVAGR